MTGLLIVAGFLTLNAATALAIYRHSPNGEIRRARRHYAQAIAADEACLARRAREAKQQADDDWELLEVIWAFTLGLEEGSSQ